jgi:aspartate ammonia-lyase
MTTQATRIEHDLLGEKAVPADAYYGVQTARALENFHISGVELRLYGSQSMTGQGRPA